MSCEIIKMIMKNESSLESHQGAGAHYNQKIYDKRLPRVEGCI